MKIIGLALAVLLVVGSIIGIGYGAFSGYEFLSVQWSSLNNDLRAIMIVAGTILVACSFYVAWSVQSAMKRYALKGAGKVQAYNAFVEWYSKLKENESEVLSASSLKVLRNQMMLWGSHQVAKQVNLLFEELQKDAVDRDEVLKKAGHVYLEIRRDLGLRGGSVDNPIV